MQRIPDLVLDVGLMDGFDAEFYVSCGYRVISIEADPVKVHDCSCRLRHFIDDKRLEILNTGIAAESATLTFYRNFENEGWSSLIPENGKRGGRFESIEVPCVTLASVVEKYGVPHYIKIDIEGMDEVALGSLTPDLAPDYISIEVGSAFEIIDRLHTLGYRSFKLIYQELHSSAEDIYDSEFGWRLLRKLGRAAPPIKRFLSALPENRVPKAEWRSPYVWQGKTFDSNASGPFGEAAHGPWIGYEEARRKLKRALDHVERHHGLLWMDVHAKLEAR